MPAPPGGVIGRDAVLIFEAALGPEVLISDAAWRASRSPAWTLAPTSSALEGLPVEVLDSRLIPTGWNSEDFDDSGWVGATVLSAVHVGGMGRDRPPTYLPLRSPAAPRHVGANGRARSSLGTSPLRTTRLVTLAMGTLSSGCVNC